MSGNSPAAASSLSPVLRLFPPHSLRRLSLSHIFASALSRFLHSRLGLSRSRSLLAAAKTRFVLHDNGARRYIPR